MLALFPTLLIVALCIGTHKRVFSSALDSSLHFQKAIIFLVCCFIPVLNLLILIHGLWSINQNSRY